MVCVCSGLLDEYPEDTTVMFGVHWQVLKVLYWYAAVSGNRRRSSSHFQHTQSQLDTLSSTRSMPWEQPLCTTLLTWVSFILPNSGCVYDKTWSWISRALKDWINLWSLTFTITRLSTCVAWIRSPLCSKFLLQWVYQRVLTWCMWQGTWIFPSTRSSTSRTLINSPTWATFSLWAIVYQRLKTWIHWCNWIISNSVQTRFE